MFSSTINLYIPSSNEKRTHIIHTCVNKIFLPCHIAKSNVKIAGNMMYGEDVMHMWRLPFNVGVIH